MEFISFHCLISDVDIRVNAYGDVSKFRENDTSLFSWLAMRAESEWSGWQAAGCEAEGVY